MGASCFPGGGVMIEQLPSGKLFFSSAQCWALSWPYTSSSFAMAASRATPSGAGPGASAWGYSGRGVTNTVERAGRPEVTAPELGRRFAEHLAASPESRRARADEISGCR
jgi:hypothetical protein